MNPNWILISFVVTMMFQLGTSRSIDYRRSPYVSKVNDVSFQIGIFHSDFIIDFLIVLSLTFGKKNNKFW